jgi:hypothetical protein
MEPFFFRMLVGEPYAGTGSDTVLVEECENGRVGE